jgi:nuclear GTP-binding protein
MSGLSEHIRRRLQQWQSHVSSPKFAAEFLQLIRSSLEIKTKTCATEAQDREGLGSQAEKAAERGQKSRNILSLGGERPADQAIQNPQWKSRLKKDPGIPNLFPFKDKILAEVEERKRLGAEESVKRVEAAKANKDETRDLPMVDAVDDGMAPEDEEPFEEMAEDEHDSNPMAALLASAQARATEYQGDDKNGDMDEGYEDSGTTLAISEATPISYTNPDSSRRAFDRIFKQVLEEADVILYVLDARDPEGTRSREVERQIMAAESGSKRLLLILNKIDLVPPPVLSAWLLYLRGYFPTIPLRASPPASNAQTFDHQRLTVEATSETLLRALKSYSASAQMKRSMSVGVIGYPNVGKSSIINALTSRFSKGSKSAACPVGSEAGVTTSLREVKVDKKLKVLDSPGIVFPSATKPDEGSSRKANDEARLILLNTLPPKQISDPIPAVSLLLSRLSSSPVLYEKLLQTYGITALGVFGSSDTTTDFLIQVARKRGRIGKGGVPNINAAAMAVITDWRDGRIQGWVDAPALQVTADRHVSATESGSPSGPTPDRKTIVKEWAAEFRLEGLWGDGPQEEDVELQ